MRFTVAVLAGVGAFLYPGQGAAQTRSPTAPGALILGGVAGVSGSSIDNADASTFVVRFDPEIGVFVVRGLAVRGVFRLGYSKANALSTTTWAIGPGIGYYAGGADRLLPFVRLQPLFARASRGGSDTRSTTLQIDVGAVYLLVPHVGLSAALYLDRTWTTVERTFTVAPMDTEIRRTGYGLLIGFMAFAY